MSTVESRSRKLTVQVFLERRRSGEIWVPYKTFIGFRRGRWVMIADRAEHLYDTREFDSRDAAVTAAASRARTMIGRKFPEYADQDLDWDVVEEGCAVRAGGRSASDPTRSEVRDGHPESPTQLGTTRAEPAGIPFRGHIARSLGNPRVGAAEAFHVP